MPSVCRFHPLHNSVAAKTLCIPFDQPDLPAGTPCFVSGQEAKCWVLWGRSY